MSASARRRNLSALLACIDRQDLVELTLTDGDTVHGFPVEYDGRNLVWLEQASGPTLIVSVTAIREIEVIDS